MKLKFSTKLSYGIGGICDNALYTLTGTYLLLYLTTVAGVNPAIAGTISAAGSVWEAICGPIVGFKSDSTKSRFGSRKPFLMVAAFPVAIVTSLLFTSIDASPSVKAIYYGVMILLFWTVFATFFVPYLAWGSDLTEDYHERTVLRSYAYIFNQVGMCIGMVMPTIIVDYFMNLGKTTQQSWQMAGIFTGACGGAALLLCALTIHNDDNKDFIKQEVKEKFLDLKVLPSMFKEYFDILKLKPIRYLLGASVVYLIANTIFSSDRVFYMTFNLGIGDKTISLMMMIITISGVALVPFIAALAGKFDKKNVFMAGIGVSGLLMISARFVGVNSTASLIALFLIYSVANTCYWQLMPSMIYDVCEVEELFSGEKRSGAVISLQALSESLSIAVGLQALGIILDAAGFASEAAVQPEAALAWVSNTFTLIPGVFMLLVVGMMTKYPINKSTFSRVLYALERKRSGEEVDIKEFEDIFE